MKDSMESLITADAGLWSHEPMKPPHLLNPIVLAYIGDSVFELIVRQYLISQPNHKLQHLHRQATGYVSAKAQCALLEKWRPLLTETEADMVRRGRNGKSGSPPKNADIAEYRQATGLECLVGYLYYSKQIDRLHELMRVAFGERTDEAGIAISKEVKE